MRHTGPRIDLTGKRFGRWTVVGLASKRLGRGYCWTCVCDCGATNDVVVGSLNNGASQSCGCLHREKVREMKTIHGGKGTPEYRAWKHMRGRCNDPGDSHFRHYGGRGITLCDRWADFVAFREDMGRRPSSRHSIERLDVNGNYEPSNCVWATTKEQSLNKRTTVFVSADGVTGKLVEVAAVIGISTSALRQRVRRGTYGASRLPA